MVSLKNRLLPIITLSISIMLAVVAACYSVFGISKLFASQAIAVIIMASVLEISKLITAAYLERYWDIIGWLRKVYLVTAMLVLMAITSLGIYGFLVSAYQDTAYKVEAVDKQVDLQHAKKDRFTSQLSLIVTEKQTLEANIAQLTKGLSNNVLTRIDRNGNTTTTTSETTRRALEKQLDQSMVRRDTLSVKEYMLNDSINSIDLRILQLQSNSSLASEIGPLRHVAKLSNKKIDTVINWFILLFIIVFDPLAIILLISANKTLRSLDTKKVISNIEPPIPEPSIPIINDSKVIGSKWWGGS